MRKTRFAAAALAVVSVMSFAPAANAATCQTLVDVPSTGIEVLGNPVPSLYLALCGEVDTDPSSLPTVRVETYGDDPTVFAVFLDVPDEFYKEDVWLRYSLGGEPQDYAPVNPSGDPSICVFYTGPQASNPGGCIFGLLRDL